MHSQRPALPAGTQIGKYIVERHLGEGGNGAVYAATDQVLGRRVALKLLHPELVFEPQIAGRFRQEAQAMAQLNHPNVVTVHDLVGDAGTWAIVMELIEGGETLASVLRREGRLAPLRALRLIEQVAAGLGHAHARGIVHRDVKPANVMIVRHAPDTEIAKISDFGIARLVHGDKRTQGQLTLGTLWYLAPEQAQSSSVDARADIYALGATLYEALTGRVIFPYHNVARVLAAALSEAPTPPSQLAPGIAPELDATVLRFVAKSPELRPADGERAREELVQLARRLGAFGEPGRSSPSPATPLHLATSPAPSTPGTLTPGAPFTPAPVAPTRSSPVPSFHPAAPAIHAQAVHAQAIQEARLDGASASPTAPGAASPGSPPRVPPSPAVPPSLAASAEGRIGFWITVGTVAVVSFACLSSSLLCVVTGMLR